MLTVMFVCTQNVFRSLSAEKLMHFYLEENNFIDFKVLSSGIVAHPYEKPYSYTYDKLQVLGIEDFFHRNQKISQELVEKSDIIICMTKEHKNFVESNYRVKAYLFNEIAYGEKKDLYDDVETNFENLEEFVYSTIEYINTSMPYLVENLLKLEKRT